MHACLIINIIDVLFVQIFVGISGQWTRGTDRWRCATPSRRAKPSRVPAIAIMIDLLEFVILVDIENVMGFFVFSGIADDRRVTGWLYAYDL
jgi:hypothetical protein